MGKRDVLQGVSLGLGEFGLVDPGGVAQRIAQLPMIDRASIAKIVRAAGLKLPPSVSAETVASQIVARVEASQKTAGDGCVVLFLAASPLDQERLAIDSESREIRKGIRGTPGGADMVMEFRWAAHPDDLLECANEVEPDVIHFSGHGSERAGIVLAGDGGESRFVSGDLLKRIIEQFRKRPAVCLLNACFSEDQAKEIVKAVPCVVGMGDEIGDPAAIAFAMAFYRAIASRRSVAVAFVQGCLKVEIDETREEATPRLLESKRGIASKTFLL